MDISSNLNNQLLLLFTEIINNRPLAEGITREASREDDGEEIQDRQEDDREERREYGEIVDNSNNYYITSYFGHINPNVDLWDSNIVDLSGSGSGFGSDFSGNEYQYQYFDTINIPLDRRIRFRNNFLNYLNIGIDLSNVIANNQQNINNFIDSTLDSAKPVYKKIASDAGLRQVEEVVYHEDVFAQNMCPIYCVPFSDGETVSRLPCKHIFSKDGIYKWLQESHVCPVCRFCLDCVEVKHEHDNDNHNEIQEGRDNENDILEGRDHDEITGINYQQDSGGLGSIQNIVSPFNLVNVLLQQGERLRQRERLEEMEYQEAIMRSLNES